MRKINYIFGRSNCTKKIVAFTVVVVFTEGSWVYIYTLYIHIYVYVYILCICILYIYILYILYSMKNNQNFNKNISATVFIYICIYYIYIWYVLDSKNSAKGFAIFGSSVFDRSLYWNVKLSNPSKEIPKNKFQPYNHVCTYLEII